MYSESDLETAVAAGVLSPDTAEAFRNHVSTSRATPVVDEESFRLLTGFNDIFVTIAIALLLTALAWIGGEVTPGLGGLLVAGASWGLAEYFTSKRRMALPSIALLIAFVCGVAATQVGALIEIIGQDADLSPQVGAMIGGAVALGTAASAWFHWRRFQVPITVAAGAVASVGVFLATVAAINPDINENILWFILLSGIATFGFAMWWDRQDRSRTTRRSDVAFWLHLAAAPMIAHPIFHLLGVLDGDIGVGQAIAVLALYAGFAAISLAVDRRALLVSSLVYVLFAMSSLFKTFGAVSMSVSLTALIIGSALLMLSAFWQTVRHAVVNQLPEAWQLQLPVAAQGAIPRPAS
jgi:hypothetical protein